ncbi:MAG: thermonuclease family protein [Candidatus Omnitrophota bacterium]|nr:thermonuclease family protein [Candidatus Omnitrophota bacterium]
MYNKKVGKINIFHKKLWKILPVSLALILAAVYAFSKFSVPFSPKYAYNNVVLVSYVADGDTVKLKDGSWVRLIGIDTPEYHESEKLLRQARRAKKDIASIKKMGALAKSFTQEILLNKKARLEFDVEKRDKYKRLLAYIFLEDGTFVNAKIIEAGYAKIMTIPPNVKYADMFRQLQEKARTQKIGLWQEGYY